MMLSFVANFSAAREAARRQKIAARRAYDQMREERRNRIASTVFKVGPYRFRGDGERIPRSEAAAANVTGLRVGRR